MKKLHKIILVFGSILTITAVILGSIYFANHYLAKNNAAATRSVVSCKGSHVVHVVDIRNDGAIPQHTQAKICDSMTIINLDNKLLLIAFGPHEHHQPYDGITEKLLSNNQSLTITLNQAGTYTFHDHLRDKVTGSFTVAS